MLVCRDISLVGDGVMGAWARNDNAQVMITYIFCYEYNVPMHRLVLCVEQTDGGDLHMMRVVLHMHVCMHVHCSSMHSGHQSELQGTHCRSGARHGVPARQRSRCQPHVGGR